MQLAAGFIVNHLWQSSCFVLFAGLLALVLSKNSPSVRYWIWLCASLKFLVPLALLVSLEVRSAVAGSTCGIGRGSRFSE